MTDAESESRITDEAQLEEVLSRPTGAVRQALASVGGDILLLGAGGKIGPSISRMARRALDDVGSAAAVIAVSRFGDEEVRDQLEADGVRTISADLGDPSVYDSLPDAAGMLYLAAMKFGTTGQEARTWWSNASIPTFVASRYRKVPTVVYSTGNVYPLMPLVHGGASESEPPAPLGEYAQSCLARERVFTHAAQTWGTPTTIFRLNYACELRYGVISDIATKIYAGEPVDVTMPAVNVVWQGDVNEWALRSLGIASTPPAVLNATGPETMSVRRLAALLAEQMDTELILIGEESADALLSDASRCHETFGYPSVPLRRLVGWVGDWVSAGGRQLGKATKFQQRKGAY